MSEFYEIHCGLLPLAHRFIVVKWNGTQWVIPASVALDLTVKYYEKHGWYEECELKEEGYTQPHGDELRGCVEANSDLAQTIRDEQWRRVERFATKVGVADSPNDQGWWFEEHGGSIREMTDLPIENQIPLKLLWFDAAYKQIHRI